MSEPRRRLRDLMSGREGRMVAASLGLVLASLALVPLLGLLGTVQVLVTFLLPAGVMLWFWKSARARIDEHDSRNRLDSVYQRATGRFLARVAPDLRSHPENCNLRAESSVVALDYQELGVDLKVVVPEMVVRTDPLLLRQMLHVFVANAISHGGERVAIWAASEGERVTVTVSDDGPGLPPEEGDRVFQDFVDLAGIETEGSPTGSGLSIAASIARVLGGRAGYRRDTHWSHFSVTIPVGVERRVPADRRVPLRLGAR